MPSNTASPVTVAVHARTAEAEVQSRVASSVTYRKCWDFGVLGGAENRLRSGTRRLPSPPLLKKRKMLVMSQFKCNEVTSYHSHFISVLTHRCFFHLVRRPNRPHRFR